MEVLVEHLHEVMDGLQVAQVVVVHVHADAKVQASVTTVDYLKVAELKTGRKWTLDKQAVGFCFSRNAYLDKVGVFCIPDRDQCVHLLDKLLLLVIIKVHVPLGQAGLSGTVLDQDETDLEGRRVLLVALML